MKRASGGRRRNVVLQRAVSVATLAAAGAVPVWAQNVQSGEKVEEVVVIGFRDALESAQAIKRDADTHVDSITATDIGAFPDKSVAEALQRVPGITTSRLQSSDDSNHFSAEPSTVLIRGLTFVRTEVNGRDTFSADGYRGLNFNDISPELMQGIDTYKNQTAEMIEGGIAGVVNLRTRVPFDSEGQVIALTGRVNYGDRSDEPTYEASGLYSNVWETDVGRFGAMVNGAYSHITTRTEAVNMHRISTFCSDYAGASGTLPAVVSSDGTIDCNSNPYGGSGWRYAPNQVNFSQVDYDRKRYGAALALQYENNDETVLVTVQGIDSRYKNPWIERSSNINFNNGAGFGTPSWAPFASPAWRPVTGSFNFGADGMLDSGVLGQPITASGFDSGTPGGNINRGSAVPGMPFVNDCDMDPVTPGIQTGGCNQLTGSTVSNESRIFDHVEGTRDLSFNIQWDVTDRLRSSFDAQYIKAKTNNYDILVAANTLATANYSTNGDGTPQIELTPAPNTNYATGFLANPHNYWMQFIQDHWEDNDAEEAAARLDVEYDLGSGGWLSSLKAGVRFADRDQKVRYSSYNWAPIAPAWGCNGAAFNVDTTTADAVSGRRGLSERQLPGLSRRHLGIDQSQQSFQRRRVPQWPDGLPESRHAAQLRSAHRRTGRSQHQRSAGMESVVRSCRQHRRLLHAGGDRRRHREEQGRLPDAAFRRAGCEDLWRHQRRGQRRRPLCEDRLDQRRQRDLPDGAVVQRRRGRQPGRLQPERQRPHAGHRYPMLADTGVAGVQQRHGPQERARQVVQQCPAELQRAFRDHARSVHPIRLLARNIAPGLRAAA